MSQDFWAQKRLIQVVSDLSTKPVEIFYENPLAPQKPKNILLLAHPHPLHGGNWHNKLISTMARAAHKSGCASLRLHFSTVGGTPGPYTGMADECALLEKLLSNLKTQSNARWLAAGFSFGGGVVMGLPWAQLPRFVIAPSWQELKDSHEPALKQQQVLTVAHAHDDDVVPIGSTEALLKMLGPGPEHNAHILGSGGHFFQGHEPTIRMLFQNFISQQLGKERVSGS